MLRKSLIMASIFCLIAFMSSFVFAANVTENAGNGIKNIVKSTTNSVQNGAHSITNMMYDMGNNVRDDAGYITDNMENGNNNHDGAMHTGNDGFDGYTASRTGATANIDTATNNATVWMILAIVAVLIVALVWYYASQTNDIDHH